MWKEFWDGLNIRKFIGMLLVLAYILYIFTTGQDLGIKDVLLIIVGYWFGYSNGQNVKPV
jgi:hypothetical protein